MCGSCVLPIYSIPTSILCVSQKGLSFVESNQRMYCFYKRVILSCKDIVNFCKVNFFIKKLFIQCNTGSCSAHISGDVSVYLYVSVNILVSACPVCVCLCLWYQIRVNQEPFHLCQTCSKFNSLMHKTHTKVLLVLISWYHNAIKQNNKLVEASWHIELKKRGNKKRAFEQNFKKEITEIRKAMGAVHVKKSFLDMLKS